MFSGHEKERKRKREESLLQVEEARSHELAEFSAEELFFFVEGDLAELAPAVCAGIEAVACVN